MYICELKHIDNNTISLEDLSASTFHNYFLIYTSGGHSAYKDYNYKDLIINIIF